MKIVLAGGTGFIGSALIDSLSRDPHDIVILTRTKRPSRMQNSSSISYVEWDPLEPGEWQRCIDGADVVINLVGKNLFEDRWNPQVKKEIWESRVVSTTRLVEAIAQARSRPHLFVSGSAIGIYGDRGDEQVTETSTYGNDFLSTLVQAWESAAMKAETYGVRVAVPRIGIVLERSGGLVKKFTLPFKLFAGGPVGTGRQFVSWVHMDDVVSGILFPLHTKEIQGAYNLVAPQPVTMREFCSTFGGVLHRPSWIPVPYVALYILFGEGASMIVSGQRVSPDVLQKHGFPFSFSSLDSALKNILT